MVEAVFFWADLSEPRALAALASNTGILKRDGGVEGWRAGGVEGWRAGVLALDPVGAGVGDFERTG